MSQGSWGGPGGAPPPGGQQPQQQAWQQQQAPQQQAWPQQQAPQQQAWPQQQQQQQAPQQQAWPQQQQQQQAPQQQAWPQQQAPQQPQQQAWQQAQQAQQPQQAWQQQQAPQQQQQTWPQQQPQAQAPDPYKNYGYGGGPSPGEPGGVSVEEAEENASWTAAIIAAVVHGKGFVKPRSLGLAFLGVSAIALVANFVTAYGLNRYYPFLALIAGVLPTAGLFLVATNQPRRGPPGTVAPLWARAGLAVSLLAGAPLAFVFLRFFAFG